MPRSNVRTTRRPPRLICASARFVRSDDWRYGVSPEIFRDFATGLRSDYRGTLDRFVALEAFGSDHAKEEVRALREDLFSRGEPSAHVLADGLDLLKTADLRAAMPRLASPSLWLAGRRDRLVDARAMRDSAALAHRTARRCMSSNTRATRRSSPMRMGSPRT